LARELQEDGATTADGRLNAVIANERVKTSVKTKIWNGQDLRNQSEMPARARQLCDDVMRVIENNGEVTLPSGLPAEPLFTKRQRQLARLIVWALIFAGLLVVARAIK